jgi:hypothetical protein
LVTKTRDPMPAAAGVFVHVPASQPTVADSIRMIPAVEMSGTTHAQ